MLKRQKTRRVIAALGLVLALIFTFGVLRAVALGDTEWWNLLVLVPALAIAYQLYRRWYRPRPPQRE
jgi:hypothetical protein